MQAFFMKRRLMLFRSGTVERVPAMLHFTMLLFFLTIVLGSATGYAEVRLTKSQARGETASHLLKALHCGLALKDRTMLPKAEAASRHRLMRAGYSPSQAKAITRTLSAQFSAKPNRTLIALADRRLCRKLLGEHS